MSLREVSSGEGIDGNQTAKVDIVAIHGLNPLNDEDHAFNTWRKPKTASGMLWLRDYLPQSTPNARIFIYKYNSNPVFAASKERFIYHANDLLERLHIARDTDRERPLIIIAHSLGGILAKQALVNASSNPRHKPIYEATSAIAFFGTPHAGGSEALVELGNASIRIVRGLFRSPPNDIMQAVERGSLYADILQENWRHQLSLYKIVSFYEETGSIVSRESATIGLPGDVENVVCITADHSNMCCFNLSNDNDKDNFDLVRANIKELYEFAMGRRVRLPLRFPQVPTSELREAQVLYFDVFIRFAQNFAILLTHQSLEDVRLTRNVVEKGHHPHPLQSPINATLLKNPSNLFPSGIGRSHSYIEKFGLMERILGYVPELGRLVFKDSIDAFYTYDYEQEYDMNFRDREKGTCEWLCRHEDYKWLLSTSASSLLWLSGRSGLGKTTLLTHVVAQLQQLQKIHNPEELVLYSFCEAHVNDDGGDVISVLIHQLLTTIPKLRPLASKKIREYQLKDYPSSTMRLPRSTPKSRPAAKLWQLLCYLIQNSRIRRVFLVIDALDECKKSSQIDLIHFFAKVVPGVRILVSSKPNEGLRAEFSKWLARSPSTLRRLNADDEDESIRKDIEHYLAVEVDRIGELRGYSNDRRNTIKNHLQEYCSGIFLIAKLMLKRLETAPVSDLDETLRETPSDLPILYLTLLNEIPLSIRSKRSEIFKVLMYTCEPLSIRELAFASQSWTSLTSSTPPPLIDDDYIEGFRKDLLLYGPMLRIRGEDNVVSFIHPSVKEFLVGHLKEPGSPNRQFLVQPGRAQQEIAIACLKLLIFKSNLKVPGQWESGYLARTDDLFREHLLLSYALHYWHKHLLDAIEATGSFDNIDQELIHLVRSVGKLWQAPDKANFTNLVVRCCGLHSSGAQDRISEFEFFSWLGLSAFIVSLLKDPLLPHLEHCVESAIRLAIKGGHTDTVAAITDHFHITSLDDPGYEGIITDAAWSGKSALVTRVQRMRSSGVSELGQATIAAIVTGSHAVLQSLVHEVNQFQRRDEHGMTVLHRIFFDNFNSDDWKSILASALFHVHDGVDIGAQDCFGNTALHYAAWSPGLGTPEVLKSLIHEGADPTVKNRFLWAPLHLAARRARSSDCLETLLRTGGNAMINSPTGGCSTPLHWATGRLFNSREDILVIRTMLLYGADPHAANLKGVTPMQLVSNHPWMLGVFQTVYTRLDGVDHVRVNAAISEARLLLTLEGEASGHDNERLLGLLEGGIDQTAGVSSTNTLTKIKKPRFLRFLKLGFLKRLKYWK